jgi:hypothetical protein
MVFNASAVFLVLFLVVVVNFFRVVVVVVVARVFFLFLGVVFWGSLFWTPGETIA